MKKLLFLLPLLAIISCAKNEARILNNGCIECIGYNSGESFIINGVSYVVADRQMIEDAISNGDDLTRYCTSLITDMSQLFHQKTLFNQDISSWDVSNVVAMDQMFLYASSFNQNIGNWDMSKVKYTGGMFDNASSFNQDIGNWDMSNVKHTLGFSGLISMFEGALSFNHDLSDWCVIEDTIIPEDFSTNSALTASNHPVWGTCP